MANNYWAERQAKVQEALTRKNIKETEEQLNRYYASTLKKVLGSFKQVYTKYLLSIEEGKEPTPADLYKLDSYWQFQAQLKIELQKLGDKQSVLLAEQFVKQYTEIYEAVAIRGEVAFSTIDKKTALQMINEIWCADGKSWSSRIWGNMDRLQQALNENLTHILTTGISSSELKRNLIGQALDKMFEEKLAVPTRAEFMKAYNRADSVVRTELAHIQTQSARNKYLDNGVREVEVWADKDERRCEVCGKLHQKRFPIGGQMPVPAHPRCRCCILPVIEEYEQLEIEGFN